MDKVDWLNKITESPLSVEEYMRIHDVPFSISQYYRYKKQYKTNPTLSDGRAAGNRRKLSLQQEGYLKAYLEINPHLTIREVIDVIDKRFDVFLSEGGISKILKRLNIKLQPKKKPRNYTSSYLSCGGFEIIIALAQLIKWPEFISDLIARRVIQVTKDLEITQKSKGDNLGRNKKGQFTTKYNQRKDVRADRFKSIDEKNKNFLSMSLSSASTDTIMRKCIASLSLPILTSNGMVKSVNVPQGNALAQLCGFNYKQSTLNKFFAELKYLTMSEDLIKSQAGFWKEIWRKYDKRPKGSLICYYIDGNTKPLWSKKNLKKNKVTMLGKVMGCLEQVFIHDNFGRPLYFETHSGHAPSGKYVLELFDTIEKVINDEPYSNNQVNRALIFDGASNSVATLRAFAKQQKYHYITSLDNNQWSEQKVIKKGRITRYHHGEANLQDCEIELVDSKDKGYLITSRAIRIHWDHGKTTYLITSIPREATNASLLVKSYFERWPYQELQFKEMKSAVSINKVAGYGKREIDNPHVKEKRYKLKEKIKNLKTSLSKLLSDLDTLDSQIATLVKKELKIKRRSTIKNGLRHLKKEDAAKLKSIQKHIEKLKRAKISCIEPNKKEYNSLTKKEAEWLRLQSRERVYKADVELDQLMTNFRVSLANLSSLFVSKYLKGHSISFSNLVQKIFMLPAVIEETKSSKTVKLKFNEKDKDLMQKLQDAIKALNSERVFDLSGRVIVFELSNDTVT